MHDQYYIEDSQQIITPALLIFLEMVETNLEQMVRIASDPARLRPHVKTHKTIEIIRMQSKKGIKKFKAATFAECEILAQAGARNILLAYHLVGHNIERAVQFLQRFPEITFLAIADHPKPVESLNKAMVKAGQVIEVLLDVDTGQHRTGLPTGKQAQMLYEQIGQSQGLKPGGLHIYDGQLRQHSLEDRATAVHENFKAVTTLYDELTNAGWPVPRLVCGGTASFPVYAKMQDKAIELSPGTCIFHDAGYETSFPDLPFKPAAVILTRVISLPGDHLVTLDLGYKAVASDQPMEKRVIFPTVPDAKLTLQNEEHLVIKTAQARRFQPGDELVAIPWHICPTTALNKELVVISQGRVKKHWAVAARDRYLTI